MSAASAGGNRNLKVAVVTASIAAGMVGVAYAAVPLYQLFCQITGFGGTTQRAEAAPDVILDRTVRVTFDANVNSGLGWQFKPVQHEQTVRIGESTLAFYQAVNTSSEAVVGTATFNVSPPKAGLYFSKIECFCFTEQLLEPGQSVDMPVTYYVDPDIMNDPDMKNIGEITLSYTFFRAETQPAKVSAAATGAKAGTVN
jgi:cytochrome c oxidase assembly protein subunit 11